MTTVEIRALILEALSITDRQNTPRQSTFPDHFYRGTLDDLRAIVEFLAINRGLIRRICEIPNQAWGGHGYVPWPEVNTNFTNEELDIFFEQVHFLIFQNVISPGARGNCGADLPYFHVTEYGKECLRQRDILPYDPDGYLTKLKSSATFDEWDEFYVNQSLICYNSGAYEASVIMLGISAEYITERLISALSDFLRMLEPDEYKIYTAELLKKQLTSERYIVYEKTLGNIESKYERLNELKRSIDTIAKGIYSTYLRLNRNAQSHPNKLRVEKMECLSMFISYIKYCETQHKYLEVFVNT